jgi:hypothetical protein
MLLEAKNFVLLQKEGSKDPFLMTHIIIQSKLSLNISDSKKKNDKQGWGRKSAKKVSRII